MLTLSNLLTTIRNSSTSRLNEVQFLVPTNLPENIFAVLTILRKIGRIRGFTYKELITNNKLKNRLIIYLKYDGLGNSVIDTLFLVSKPSRRVYISSIAL